MPGLAAPHVGGGGCGDSSVEEPGVSDVDSGQALLGCYPTTTNPRWPRTFSRLPGSAVPACYVAHHGEDVMFTSITFFTGMDDVRRFAGEDPERAVVEDTARRALTRRDERVTHHEVIVDLRR